MPCRSGFEDEPTIRIVDKHLQPELDKVTALLCAVSLHLQRDNPTVFQELRVRLPHYNLWVKEHEAVDAQRWYKHYRGTYPNFSLDEIAKMVRNGILEVP